MNIVFLSARTPPHDIGGGELSTRAIAEGLSSLGHTVTVLAGAPRDEEDTRLGVRVVRSRRLHPLWAKPLFERVSSDGMRAALREILPLKADVVHAHDFRSALLLSRLGRPNAAVTVRDFAPICGTTSNMWRDGTSCTGCSWPNVLLRCHRVVEASPARKPFRVWQYRWNLEFRGAAYRAIPHHVYISQALKDRIATRMAVPRTAAVIPNPVGAAWLEAPLRSMDATAPIVVVAGRVETTKGIGALVDAFAIVARALPTSALEIIGGGELAAYRRRAHARGIGDRVRFLGNVTADRVRDRMDRARVVAQPSLWEEPFGRTVIEAHARARPVVASDTGGLRETVTDGTGTLVPPGDARALARALIAYLTDRARARAEGAAGRARAEARFSPARIARAYEAFYRNTVIRNAS